MPYRITVGVISYFLLRSGDTIDPETVIHPSIQAYDGAFNITSTSGVHYELYFGKTHRYSYQYRVTVNEDLFEDQANGILKSIKDIWQMTLGNSVF